MAMKTVMLALAMLFFVQETVTLTQAERDKAVAELESSRTAFLDATKNLSEAQWNWKPAPDRWSVAECAEHIGVTEALIFKLLQENALTGPPQPEKREFVKGKDETAVAAMLDRSYKAKAPEAIQPTRRWATPSEITKNVLAARAATLTFVQTTQLDLRDHFMDHPAFKTLDVYQWMLVISAHMRRHTAQILEVEADPNFPKH